jgi:DNA-binding NarL/FixJ family response regulator
MDKTTILLVDDHQLMRMGLRSLLEKEPSFEVVGEADSGRHAVRMALELRPNVVVMDVAMADLNGIDATRQIRTELPDTRIVALSMHVERRFITGMLSAGASGYVLKSGAFEELVEAIRAVRSNGIYASPRIAAAVVEDYVARLGKVSPSSEHLSAREREVLQLIAEGKSTKEIATRLHVSVNTVDTHRRRIMEKLGLYSVAELTKYAVREGLTSLED